MILVTGATGTVGRAVAAALRGRAAVKLALRRPSQAPAGALAVRFDYADPSTYARALEDVTRAFLLFPPRLRHAPQRFTELLTAMGAAGVRQVVLHSVRGADRMPLPHRRIERAVERSGLGWTHLRPNDFMQNFATVPIYRDPIREKGELWAPAGRARTSYIDVRDVADAAAAVLTSPGHEGRAYTLTGPEALSLEDVAERIGAARGAPVRYVRPSIPRFVLENRRRGQPAALTAVTTMIALVARTGAAAVVDPALPRLIGKPPRTFDRFAADHAAAWRLEPLRSPA